MHYLCLHYRPKAAGQHAKRSGNPCTAAGGLLGDDDSAVIVKIEDGSPHVYGVERLHRPDQLERYWIIEARDLNDAIRIGGRILAGTGGYLEVRPIEGDIARPHTVTGTP